MQTAKQKTQIADTGVYEKIDSKPSPYTSRESVMTRNAFGSIDSTVFFTLYSSFDAQAQNTIFRSAPV